MHRIALSVLAAVAAFSFASYAHGETLHDGQAWVNLTVMGGVSGDAVYFLEVQPRMGDDFSRLDTLLLRGAAGWKVSPTLTLYQGYAHVITPVDGGRDINEERTFQQLNLALGKPLGGDLSSRTRVEQRWRSNGGDMGWRLREMVRYERPLRMGSDSVNALVYAEAFLALNDTDWGARGGFDQLRSFIGTEVGLAGPSTLELGYLNQTVNQTGGHIRMNHAASITLFYRQ